MRQAKRKPKFFSVSAFTGPLKFKDTGLLKMCDHCQKELAMWKHEDTTGKDVYLCFGCGDH